MTTEDTFIAEEKLTNYGLYGPKIGTNGHLTLKCDTTITLFEDCIDNDTPDVSHLGNVFNDFGENLLERCVTIFTSDVLILDELCDHPEYSIFYISHCSDLIKIISKAILMGELILKKE